MTGHARDIRLARDQAQELHHGRLRVEHALVHVHVDDLRAVGHLLPGDVDGRRVIAGFDQLAELGRTGHVGALADIDEQAGGVDGQRLQAAQPAGARISESRAGHARHGSRDGAMCSGVVPQQPPTMLRKPLAANSRRISRGLRGVSSYSPKAFGKPAFG
jgi:hypothetical protein